MALLDARRSRAAGEAAAGAGASPRHSRRKPPGRPPNRRRRSTRRGADRQRARTAADDGFRGDVGRRDQRRESGNPPAGAAARPAPHPPPPQPIPPARIPICAPPCAPACAMAARSSTSPGSAACRGRRRSSCSCDISGSMARYAQILLHFLHAVANDRERVHAFLFGTRLSNITRQLRHRDPEVAFQMVAHVVPDWSGGTRIGESLAAFNRTWARRVLGQGAVVLLVTDGLDREARARPGGQHGTAASLVQPADLAQSAVALGGLRTKIAGYSRDAAACRRVPPGAQPRQPAHPDRSAVAAGP